MFKKMQNMLNNRKGFSLIELIVVIAIIGILVMLAAPRFLGYTKDAQVAGMQADAKILSDAAVLYNIEHPGEWPAGAEIDVTELVSDDLKAKLGTDTLVAIDETLLKDYVKNTKNPIAEYGLVTEGVNEGEVFHLVGLENKAGEVWHGISPIK